MQSFRVWFHGAPEYLTEGVLGAQRWGLAGSTRTSSGWAPSQVMENGGFGTPDIPA